MRFEDKREYFVPLNPLDPLNKGLSKKGDKAFSMLVIGIGFTILLFFMAHSFIMSITGFGFLLSLIIVLLLGIVFTVALVLSVYIDKETLRENALGRTADDIRNYWGIQPDGIGKSEEVISTTKVEYDDGPALLIKLTNGSVASASDDADVEFYSTRENIINVLASIRYLSFTIAEIPYDINSDEIWRKQELMLSKAAGLGKEFIERKYREHKYRFDLSKDNHQIANTYIIVKRGRSCKHSYVTILNTIKNIARGSQVLKIKGVSPEECRMILEYYYLSPVDIGYGNFDNYPGEITLLESYKEGNLVYQDIKVDQLFKIGDRTTMYGSDPELIKSNDKNVIQIVSIFDDIII